MAGEEGRKEVAKVRTWGRLAVEENKCKWHDI